jgi:hypothetical protein
MGKRTPKSRTARRSREPTAEYWQRVTELLSQRDQLIAEILAHRHTGHDTPLLKQAEALVTRFWAEEDWQGREELLRSASWLLGLGRGHLPADAVARRCAVMRSARGAKRAPAAAKLASTAKA